MDVPANHPGGLADGGGVHDRYEVSIHWGDGIVVSELRNVQEDSPLFGLCIRVALADAVPSLLVAYDLPPGADGVTVHTCLSPDYYRLLRLGVAELQRTGGTSWQGASNRATQVWVAVPDDEDSAWCDPEVQEPGHGVLISLRAQARSFHLLIGLGETDEEIAQESVKSARERLAALAAPELTGDRA